MNAEGNGVAVGSGKYKHGETAIIGAIPNEHYHFEQWSDGNTENPRSILVTEDIILTAEFSIDTYEVILNSDGDGTTIGSGIYEYGETATLAAIPYNGSKFIQWSDGNTDNPRIVTITQNLTLTAKFALITGVDDVTIDSPEVQKVIRDNKIFIIRGGKAYSIMGHLVGDKSVIISREYEKRNEE